MLVTCVRLFHARAHSFPTQCGHHVPHRELLNTRKHTLSLARSHTYARRRNYGRERRRRARARAHAYARHTILLPCIRIHSCTRVNTTYDEYTHDSTFYTFLAASHRAAPSRAEPFRSCNTLSSISVLATLPAAFSLPHSRYATGDE